jgi:hypothetical protein
MCGDIIRAAIMGFKGKPSSTFMMEISAKNIFTHDIFLVPLKEPFLTTSVMEVSEVYDVIETVLMSKTTAAVGIGGIGDSQDKKETVLGLSLSDMGSSSHVLDSRSVMGSVSIGGVAIGSGSGSPLVRDRDREIADDMDSMNFFGSTAYRESIHTLRSLAEDGEVTIAKKAMDKLIVRCVLLTSRANMTVDSSSLHSSSSDGMGGHINGNGNEVKNGSNGGNGNGNSLDDAIRHFENLVVKKLHQLSDIIRRPDWVAFVVWEGIQRLFDRFISSIAVLAAQAQVNISDPNGQGQVSEPKVGGSGPVKEAKVDMTSLRKNGRRRGSTGSIHFEVCVYGVCVCVCCV